ncbi:MAG: site-specific integrase [Acidimicrobiaceae bacterium]|nr:site-specific integrase [Acidimicrobiaceae bacterium]
MGPSPTVGAFLTQWLAAVKTTVRPKAYPSYEGTVRLHLAPHIGRVQLRRLTPAQVQSVLTVKADAGLSPRSVRYVLLVLRVALGQAERWGLVSRNVARLVDGPRVPYRVVSVLTLDECRQLLGAARGDRLDAVYTLTVALGLRRGEVLGLRWVDVDLDRRRLTIGAALQHVQGRGLVLVETKTARSRRVITLPEVCPAALRAHRIRQIQDKLAAGSRWVETGFVFTTEVGTALDGDAVGRRFRQLLRDAGLPPIRFHDLRHSTASLLLAQGVAPRVVMDVLWHSQIGVTMNTYSHVMPSLLDAAAAAVDRALGNSGREAGS